MLHVCFDACAFYVFYHAWISGVPDPPVILNVTVLSARSVFLTWNTTSAQSSANYSVEFSNDSFTWKNATCNQSSVPEACIVQHSEAMVSWLKPYTNYTFRVAAENSFGRSNYSGESKLILTDEAGNCLPHGIFFFFLCINFNKLICHFPLCSVHVSLSLRIYQLLHIQLALDWKWKKKKNSGDMIAKGDSFCHPSLKVPTEMIMPSCSMHRQIHARPYHGTRARGRGDCWTLPPWGFAIFGLSYTFQDNLSIMVCMYNIMYDIIQNSSLLRFCWKFWFLPIALKLLFFSI